MKYCENPHSNTTNSIKAPDEADETYLLSWLNGSITLDYWIQHKSVSIWDFHSYYNFSNEDQENIFARQEKLFFEYINEKQLPPLISAYEDIPERQRITYIIDLLQSINYAQKNTLSPVIKDIFRTHFQQELSKDFLAILQKALINEIDEINFYDIHNTTLVNAYAIIAFQRFLEHQIPNNFIISDNQEQLSNQQQLSEQTIGGLVDKLIRHVKSFNIKRSNDSSTSYFKLLKEILNDIQRESIEVKHTAISINAQKHFQKLNDPNILSAGPGFMAEDIMQYYHYKSLEEVFNDSTDGSLQPIQFPKFLSFTYKILDDKGLLYKRLRVAKTGFESTIDEIHCGFYHLAAKEFIEKAKQIFLNFQIEAILQKSSVVKNSLLGEEKGKGKYSFKLKKEFARKTKIEKVYKNLIDNGIIEGEYTVFEDFFSNKKRKGEKIRWIADIQYVNYFIKEVMDKYVVKEKKQHWNFTRDFFSNENRCDLNINAIKKSCKKNDNITIQINTALSLLD